MIVGEVVHDIRSSLDHLVWQLIRLNGGTPTNPWQVAFPICDQRGPPKPKKPGVRYWTADSERLLSGVSKKHVDMVQAFQPYRQRNPTGDLLYALNGLWNADKHRVVASAAMAAPDQRPSEVSVDVCGYPGTDYEFHFPPGPVKNGAVAAQIRLTSNTYGTPKEMHLSVLAPVQVNFGRRRIATTHLRAIGWYVSTRIVHWFAPDFPGPRETDLPFPDWPDPAPHPIAPERTIIRPQDTEKRFSGWKVWIDLPELRLLHASGTAWTPILAMWNFLSPGGFPFPVPTRQSLDAFRRQLEGIVGPDIAADVFDFFEPVERDTPMGRGVFPA